MQHWDSKEKVLCKPWYHHRYIDLTLGETVQWAVTFGILVHFSLPAEPMRQPGEHEE